MNRGDYKKEFDESVKHLEEVRESLLKASTPAEVSRIERDVRNSLLAVIHYSNFLSFWMQDAVTQRRKELRNLPLAGEAAVDSPATSPVKPAEAKEPKKAKKTKKTKAKKEKK